MNAQTGWQLFLYVIVPYACLTTLIVGHIWRYRFDQFGWTSRSSELYEKRWLLFGSPVFHYGALAAIAGHFLGLVIPKSWTAAVGISESSYTVISKVGGTLAVVLVLAGLVVLTGRRWGMVRVRLVTTRVDVVAFLALWTMVLLGFGETVVYSVFGPGYDYRPTIAVWLRGIFTFHPNVAGIAQAPEIYQVHAVLGWLFLALFPFTRFVHFWSAPVWYLTRPYVVYRRSRPDAILSPGEARGWQTIGGGRGPGERL